jgi:hypothetical protein
LKKINFITNKNKSKNQTVKWYCQFHSYVLFVLFHTDPLYVSNTLDTVTIMIVITPLGIILGNYKFLIPFNVISEEFNKNKATILEFTTKIVSRIAKIEQFVR